MRHRSNAPNVFKSCDLHGKKNNVGTCSLIQLKRLNERLMPEVTHEVHLRQDGVAANEALFDALGDNFDCRGHVDATLYNRVPTSVGDNNSWSIYGVILNLEIRIVWQKKKTMTINRQTNKHLPGDF